MIKEFFKTINWWIVIIVFVICRILDNINPNLFFVFAGEILIWAIYLMWGDWKCKIKK